MQRGMIKFSIAFTICLMLLMGCEGHISSEKRSIEEQMPDVPDNIITSTSDNAKINDNSEETTESILTSIEGVWKADECIGFIPFEIYMSGMWNENVGTGYEYMAVYEEDKERAAEDLPNFYFEIKENDEYIYVTNENRTYASPINIVVSESVEDDEYSIFVQRTVEGMDLSGEYPVTYIEFNSFVYSEEDNKIIYEPETLILTADGQFLLFKEGAFYSLRHSIQIEIMSGDFSCMNEDDQKFMDDHYYLWNESYFEWRVIDLNGDGIEDLIVQDSRIATQERPWYPIMLIIACEEDSAECLTWDLNDATEFSFCGPSGELIYYTDAWGMSIAFESYRHWYYDRDWNRQTDYVLSGVVIDSSMDGSREEFLAYNSKWIEEHPDMTEDGHYYSRYEIDIESGEQKEREALTFEVDCQHFFRQFF